jgi:hypothetical protein
MKLVTHLHPLHLTRQALDGESEYGGGCVAPASQKKSNKTGNFSAEKLPV